MVNRSQSFSTSQSPSCWRASNRGRRRGFCLTDCGTMLFALVRLDQVDQQAVVEPLVLRLTADNRRTDSTPTEGSGHRLAPQCRVAEWPDGTPRSRLSRQLQCRLRHTRAARASGGHPGRPVRSASASHPHGDRLCRTPPRGHRGADCGQRSSGQTGARACRPSRRAESVSQACGSPAPGHLMPLPTAPRSTPSTATTQFAA